MILPERLPAANPTVVQFHDPLYCFSEPTEAPGLESNLLEAPGLDSGVLAPPGLDSGPNPYACNENLMFSNFHFFYFRGFLAVCRCWLAGPTVGRTDRLDRQKLTNRQTDRSTDRRTDGQIDGQKGRQRVKTNSWTDRWTNALGATAMKKICGGKK